MAASNYRAGSDCDQNSPHTRLGTAKASLNIPSSHATTIPTTPTTDQGLGPQQQAGESLHLFVGLLEGARERFYRIDLGGMVDAVLLGGLLPERRFQHVRRQRQEQGC